jgi:hypothetical protein
MKTKLQFLPAIFAASVPVALAAESAGLNLPPGLDTLSAFTALLVTLLALTVAGDYSRLRRIPSVLTAARHAKAEHPLAA